MLIYNTLINAFKFNQIQQKAVRRMINHFELRVENLEKLIVGVDQINLDKFVETAEAILNSAVLTDVETLKNEKETIESNLAILTADFNTLDGTVTSKLASFETALDTLQNYDDTLIKQSVADLFAIVDGLGVDELELDVAGLKATVETFRTDLAAIKVYDDTVLRGLIDTVNTKVEAIKLQPLTTRIDLLEQEVDALDNHNLIEEVADLKSDLINLSIPLPYDDTSLSLRVDQLSSSLTLLEEKVNGIDDITYDDTTLKASVASLQTQLQTLKTAIDTGSNLDSLWLEIETVKQSIAGLANYNDTELRDLLLGIDERTTALENANYAASIESLRLKIERLIIPAAYNDTAIVAAIDEIKTDLLTLTSNLGELTNYDDTALRGIISTLENEVSTLSDLFTQGIDLSLVYAEINTVKDSIATLANYDDSELRAMVLAAQSSIEEIDLTPLETRVTAVEGEVDVIQAANLPTALADLSTRLDNLVIPPAYNDTNVRIEISQMKDEVLLLQRELGLVSEQGYDDSNLLLAISNINTKVRALEQEGPVEYNDTELRALIRDIDAKLLAIEIPEAYDDTNIKNELASAKSQVKTLAARVDVINEAGFDDSEMRLLIAALQDQILDIEVRTDAMVYDDTELRIRIGNKQDKLKIGENITIDETSTISSVNTIYDDTSIQTKLTRLDDSLQNLITGEINFEEFMERLSVLEADMLLVKQRTESLTSEMLDLTELVTSVEETDLSQVTAILDAINLEIEELKLQLSDTTLETQVDSMQLTIDDLTQKVNELIATGGGTGDIDPVIIAQLQDQIDLLTEHVGVLSTEYTISALVARVEDIENLAYNYIGLSDDVINFIKEYSVRALRFYSVANMIDHAKRMYGVSSGGSSGNSANINAFMHGGYNSNSYKGSVPEDSKESVVIFEYTKSLLNSLTLEGKTVAIRVNPNLGILTTDGKFVNPEMYISVVLEGLINPDTGLTYTRQFNLSNTDIIEGQFNVYINPETTRLLIGMGKTKGSWGLIPGKFVSDHSIMGMWIIEEPAPGDPIPPTLDDLTIEPIEIPPGTAPDKVVELVKDSIVSAGDKVIKDVTAGTTPLPSVDTPGVIDVEVVVEFEDGTSITIVVPVTVVKEEEPPASTEDFTITPLTVNIGVTRQEMEDLAAENIDYNGSRIVSAKYAGAIAGDQHTTPGPFLYSFIVVFEDGTSINVDVPVTVVAEEEEEPPSSTEDVTVKPVDVTAGTTPDQVIELVKDSIVSSGDKVIKDVTVGTTPLPSFDSPGAADVEVVVEFEDGTSITIVVPVTIVEELPPASIEDFTITPLTVNVGVTRREIEDLAAKNIVYNGSRIVSRKYVVAIDGGEPITPGPFLFSFNVLFEDGTTIKVSVPVTIVEELPPASIEDFTITPLTVNIGVTSGEILDLAAENIVYNGTRIVSGKYAAAIAEDQHTTPGPFIHGFTVAFEDGTSIDVVVPITVVAEDPGASPNHPFIGYHIEKTSDSSRTDNNLYLQIPVVEEGEETIVTLEDVRKAIDSYGPLDERLYEFNTFVDRMSPSSVKLFSIDTIDDPRSFGSFGGTDLETGFTESTNVYVYN